MHLRSYFLFNGNNIVPTVVLLNFVRSLDTFSEKMYRIFFVDSYFYQMPIMVHAQAHTDIHTCIHTHAYIHTDIHTHTHTHTTHTHTHTLIHILCIYVHTYVTVKYISEF